MKQKLQSKKGFTLVELMIVVVIMGILVAVAIPVYNAATKNTKVKSCEANVRVIEENLSAYIMTGNGGDAFTAATLATTGGSDIAFKGAVAADKGSAAAISSVPAGAWPNKFLATFKGGAAPTCPFDKTSATKGYGIKLYKNATGDGIDFEVVCLEKGTGTGLNHPES